MFRQFFLAALSFGILFAPWANAQEVPLIVPQADIAPPVENSEPLSPPRNMATDGTSLNELFSHQWVQTNGTGALRGSVVTLAGEDTLAVSGTQVVLAQRGRVIATTSSNASGEFYFGNVPPGYYTIIAEADNSFATFALAVLDKTQGAHLPTGVEIRVIRPKGEGIRQMLSMNVSPTVLSGTSDGMVRDPIAIKRSYSKSHRIVSSEDGKIVGRISTMGMAPELVDMSQMKAMLLKEGVEIARTDVAMNGAFEFQNVEPGCYGFAAAGNRGVAAVAFCVVRPDSLASRRGADGSVLVAAALQAGDSSSLNVEVADGGDVLAVGDTITPEDEVVEEEEAVPFVPPPVGGNMFGAGQVIGGGGSGGGGLSGIGGPLLGLGAIGAIAAILAEELDDDDNNNAIVTPINN